MASWWIMRTQPSRLYMDEHMAQKQMSDSPWIWKQHPHRLRPHLISNSRARPSIVHVPNVYHQTHPSYYDGNPVLQENSSYPYIPVHEQHHGLPAARPMYLLTSISPPPLTDPYPEIARRASFNVY
jgi:hypothetical protein